MSTWAGIVRVSHVGDRGGDTFHADEEQVSTVERYAKMHGANVAFLPPELSVSGGRPISERPSLRAAIEGVENGVYDGIVVAYLSRLTRSRSGIEIWDRVEAAGGHVHCAQENLDTSTANGRWVRDMHLANAVREREEHADRHAERRRKTVEAGVWRQRQVPLGYEFAGPAVDGRYRGKARKLVPSDRADDVRWAFRARAQGKPLLAIAERLEMTPNGARALLRNDLYLGILRDGENVNVSAHEPLVDRDTFEAAQGKVARPAQSHDGPALLAGLVRCAACGHVMTRRGAANVSYSCPIYHSGGRCPEPAAVTCALLDAHVETIALAELERISVTASGGRGVEQARTRLSDAEHELAAFLKVASARDPGFADAVQDRRDAVEIAQHELRAELGRASLVTTANSGAEMWEILDAHERNQLLRGLLEAVVVARAGGRGSRTPLPDRVRVVAFGAGLDVAVRRGDIPAGIRPLVLDADDPRVLRMPGGEDRA